MHGDRRAALLSQLAIRRLDGGEEFPLPYFAALQMQAG